MSSRARRASRPAAAAPIVDEDDILRTYKLSSLAPQRWEELDTSEVAGGTAATSGPSSGAKGDEPDALGLRRGGTLATLPDLPSSDLRSAILLHSKSFDPKTYLSTVHPNATFKDLSYGREHVKDALEQRSEALKVLVEAEFDRFVGVKAATEGVYREMKQGPLADGSDFGVRDLKQVLREASTKADSVYTPILDAAQKASRLRSTLTVFERNKFFFNLPTALLEAIEHGRYDTAMLAYKKGKYMVEGGRPQTLLGLAPTAQATPLQEEQSRRIYNKVWTQVQKIMNDLKVQLSVKLSEARLGPEEVDKTIEILLELDPDSDPAWIYLESQHHQIKERLTSVLESGHYKFEQEAHKAHQKALSRDENQAAADIRIGVQALDSSDAEQILGEGAGAPAWKALQDLVKEVSECILTSLPSFWKVAKTYMEGKYHKRHIPSSSRRNFNYCTSMTNELLTHFIATLSKFFNFTDEQIQPAAISSSDSDQQPLPPLPDFVPETSTALTAAHYIIKLLNDLSETTNELGSLSLPKQASEDLRELVTSARWRFIDVLCLLWVKDSKILYRLETWVPDPDVPSTTLYLRQADAFQRSVARRMYRVAGGSEDSAAALFPSSLATSAGLPSSEKEKLPVNFTQRIKTAYLDALYAFLDGLVHVAFSEPPDTTLNSSGLPADQSQQARKADISALDTRIMLTVSNLEFIQEKSIKKTLGQFQEAFQIDVASDVTTLRDVIKQIDRILFDNYVQRKSSTIAGILQKGILEPNIDWLHAPKPKQVHPYIYEAMLQLVLIHAQVTGIAKSLVPRVLMTLVEEMAGEALRCFKKVNGFGMGGMLQATLEIEFLHQTVGQYVSATADTSLQEIYKTISQSYYKKPNRDAEELTRELDQLKKILKACKQATILQFLCFRKASSKSSSASKAARQ